ncbi:MAG TPA: hypothetical protein PK629_11635 [Oscillospiraceae bacterium]|nr:hypothetical protein [Oscillospiraceae bacterium]HPF56003.1 hypothetical protein [Clostridiales bacterium]HPK36335.1 hypothetical protein [Oscillospiraceae bacterium]HPR76108.1 hypothetical protein [Oscillospiraceae bacterium]
MKRIFAFLTALTLLSGVAIPAFSGETTSEQVITPAVSTETSSASEKEEVVYGILNADGTVNDVFVVNIFDGGTFTDYGNYTEIKNLTDASSITQNGDVIASSSDTSRFSYQGTLASKDLPWTIAIKYFLNGTELTASELAGKTGSIEIKLSVTQNSAINSSFFDNFALQIAVTLDETLCDNIQADGATAAEASGSKQLSYIVLPGKTADISITADVHNFEMDPITINGIKMVFNFDVDTSSFTSQFSELSDAAKTLDDGAGELSDGVGKLADGMNSYADGLKAYKEGLSSLVAGASDLKAGTASLSDGLSQLTEQNSVLVMGALAIQQAIFDTVNAQLTGMGLPTLTPENYDSILSAVPTMAAVKTQLDNAIQFTQGIIQYTDGVYQFSSGAKQLSGGTSDLYDGLVQINASAQQLYDAVVELNSAIKELKSGISDYKTGTAALKDGTADMDSEAIDQIDEMLAELTGSGAVVKSFVSDKNTSVSAVQFVLKTTAIEIAKTTETEPVQTVTETFWDRILDLFGL